MSKKLDDIRAKLDEIDRRIVEALADRQNVIRETASLKIANAGKIQDYKREEEILSRLREEARKLGIDRYFVEQIFREIISHSVRLQTHALLDYHNEKQSDKAISVAYQGAEGSYSFEAANRHFGERYSEIACFGYNTFEDACRAVEQKETDVAVLPIENTTAGSINETYDLLGNGSLFIIGEEVLRIRHLLLAPEVVPVSKIRRILSHPQAIAQCSRFLAKLPNCKVESYLDTALAARKVGEDGDLSQAAIASANAAELYGLKVIQRDIANQDKNFTRFVIAARESVRCDPQIPCKTSLVIATSHEKGALIDCLRVLGDHGINMTKLESRPRPNVPWQYLFYLDIEGNILNPSVDKAMTELGKKASYLKILGSYPVQTDGERIANKDSSEKDSEY